MESPTKALCPYCLLGRLRKEATAKGSIIVVKRSINPKTMRRKRYGFDVVQDGQVLARFRRVPTVCTCI